MKKHLLGLFLIGIIINNLSGQTQCGAVVYGSSSLNLVSSSGGNCTYTISVQVSKASGNPTVQFEYRCGSVGSFTNLDPCISPTTTPTVYTSNNFTCPCSASVYGQFSGHASSNCSGNVCSNTLVTTNLAIKLANFNVENTPDKNQTCLSWSVLNPDPLAVFQVETSEDGIAFKNYGTYSHQQTFKNNSSYGLCVEKTKNTYYRLKVIEPSGLITLSPIRKINLSKTSLTVSVDRNHNRLVVFGLDHHDAIPYDIMNIYGQIISKGQLNFTSIELPALSKGMYVLRLNLPSKEVPLTWIY